ncbi:hypothetical protein JOC70_002881 [Clostridium pascui]|nr:hypothetical protein [Clostridium pascui]
MDILVNFAVSFGTAMLYDLTKWIFLHVKISIKINK